MHIDANSSCSESFLSNLSVDFTGKIHGGLIWLLQVKTLPRYHLKFVKDTLREWLLRCEMEMEFFFFFPQEKPFLLAFAS